MRLHVSVQHVSPAEFMLVRNEGKLPTVWLEVNDPLGDTNIGLCFEDFQAARAWLSLARTKLEAAARGTHYATATTD